MNLPSSTERRFRLIALAFSLLGFVIVYASTQVDGAGTSPDSVHYIVGARNLAQGEGFISFDGKEITLWPPLYFIVLAASQVLFQIDPMDSAGLINAVIFAAIIYTTWLLAMRYYPSRNIFLWTTLILATCSFAVYGISVMVSSDPLFVLLVIVFAIVSDRYLETQSSKFLVGMIVTSGLASIGRYIGVSLVISGMILIFLTRGIGLKGKVQRAVILGAVASIPLLLWSARNFVVSGTLFGPRTEATFTLLDNLTFAFYTLLGWFVPWPALIVLVVVFSKIAGISLNGHWPGAKRAISKALPLIVIICAYTSLLIYSTITTGLNLSDSKYLVPIYIPMVVLCIYLLIKIVGVYERSLSVKMLNRFIFSTQAVLILWPVAFFAASVVMNLSSGAYGYNTWLRGDLIHYVNGDIDLTGQQVYSNHPDVLHLYLGLQSSPTLRRSPKQALELNTKTSEFPVPWPSSDGYIIWFSNSHRDYLMNIEELSLVAEISEIAIFDDGGVYFVKSSIN